MSAAETQGCSQCKRKGIQCAGYRDPSALRVLNETEKILCKFKRTMTTQAAATDMAPCSRRPVAPSCPDDGLASSPGISTTLALRYDDDESLSMAYFLTQYIYATPFQVYVPAFCLDRPGTRDACRTAIEAAALAAFSRRVRSPSPLRESRKRYGQALSQVNDLLARPETAVLDGTLACVLLLGLYEAIVFEGDSSPTSWTAHCNGALQLLRLRGPQQFESRLSRTISCHASNNIKTSCFQRSVPVPEHLVALDAKMRSLHSVGEPSIMLSTLIRKLASLKARWALADADGSLLVQEALQLDRQILLLGRTVPDWMVYEIRPDSESPRWAYKRACHRYRVASAAKIWNTVRICQLFLVTFILDVVSPGHARARPDLSRLRVPDPRKSLPQYVSELEDYARRSMDTITTDLLATIPTFMHTDEQHGRRFAPPARSLAWPLTMIQSSVSSPQPARDFASRHREMLAGDLNLPEVLLHPSRSDDTTDDW
ncbi:hypothetical protein E4U41_002840 [Claviceps citrina]|nr:hypothetical protein E4U41_002840 [Claviceps citrina]